MRTGRRARARERREEAKGGRRGVAMSRSQGVGSETSIEQHQYCVITTDGPGLASLGSGHELPARAPGRPKAQ